MPVSFVKVEEVILTLMKNIKTILEKTNVGSRVGVPDFRTYYRATTISTVLVKGRPDQ